MIRPSPIELDQPPVQVLQYRRGGTIPANTPVFWGGDGDTPAEFPLYVQPSINDRQVPKLVWWAPVYQEYVFEYEEGPP